MNRLRPEIDPDITIRQVILGGLCNKSVCPTATCDKCMFYVTGNEVTDEEIWEVMRELFDL